MSSLMSIINQLFISPSAAALCWTLLHSLWQGLIAAVFAALILVWTKRSRPALRYRLLSALFLLLTLTFAATFLYELLSSNIAPVRTPVSHHEIVLLSKTTDHPITVYVNTNPSLINTIGDFLSRNSRLIVAIWFIILGVKMARMLFVFGYTRHIIRHRTQEPAVYWKDRVTLFCRQLHITRQVALLESKFVKLPVVFGQLKPVILVPLGLLTQLPAEQVEAILLHELAHIRRHDYLVNLLQNLIETLFFFNPALLWLSSLIRDEREHCCDDIAIGHLKNRRQYVESLIGFKERSMVNSPLSAVGFAGRKNSFLNRIRRIVENRNYTLSRWEKGSLACSCIIVLSIALVALSPKEASLIKVTARPVQKKPTSDQMCIAPISTTVSTAPATRAHRHIEQKQSGPAAGVIQSLGLYYGPESTPGHGYFVRERAQIDSLRSQLMMKRRLAKKATMPMLRPERPSRAFLNLQPIITNLIDDLVAAGIVKDTTDHISFNLSNSELVVNGNLQSESVHEKLKQKYISDVAYIRDFSPDFAKDPDFGLHYNSRTGSMGLGIHHSLHAPW